MQKQAPCRWVNFASFRNSFSPLRPTNTPTFMLICPPFATHATMQCSISPEQYKLFSNTKNAVPLEILKTALSYSNRIFKFNSLLKKK
ncbi:unnamed protein product [Brugia pahangi]|uniref:Uncharacterized protein n=1 Tax=Brugia pahangi TaxID=6280 RepID=A0A0N4SWR1_BRUPA|nr:unnamed protein product [Brugia pahangi]